MDTKKKLIHYTNYSLDKFGRPKNEGGLRIFFLKKTENFNAAIHLKKG